MFNCCKQFYKLFKIITAPACENRTPSVQTGTPVVEPDVTDYRISIAPGLMARRAIARRVAKVYPYFFITVHVVIPAMDSVQF